MGKDKTKEEGLRVKEKTRKMKDSGVEWIGEVPENWRIQNLKSILVERNENNKPVKTDFILSLTNDRGVIPYSEKGDIGNKSKDDLTGYKLAYPNDIVLNSMNVIIGSVGLSKYFGAVSPVYYMLYPRSEEDSVRYYNFIFQTKVFQESLKGYGNGIMEHRLRIPMMKLNTVMLPYPSAKEQREIANFLDSKVSLIDNIIEKTKQSIEDYRKYKQSLITETVTKGLNPDVEMKDSGIEWIGEIPKHWDFTKLKNYYYIFSGATPKSGNHAFWDGQITWITPADYKTEDVVIKKSKRQITTEGLNSCGATLVPINSIIVSNRAPIGAVALAGVRLCTSQGCKALVNKQLPISNKYVYYLLSVMSEPLNVLGRGTTFLELSTLALSNFGIPIPPAKEQQQIVDYLDNKCLQIDKIVEQKETLINELEAYKKSLIYEYVTGKKRI